MGSHARSGERAVQRGLILVLMVLLLWRLAFVVEASCVTFCFLSLIRRCLARLVSSHVLKLDERNRNRCFQISCGASPFFPLRCLEITCGVSTFFAFLFFCFFY